MAEAPHRGKKGVRFPVSDSSTYRFGRVPRVATGNSFGERFATARSLFADRVFLRWFDPACVGG
jgi:hypothetical protein